MKYVIAFGTLPMLATICFLAAGWAKRKAGGSGDWSSPYYRLHGIFESWASFLTFGAVVLIAGFALSESF